MIAVEAENICKKFGAFTALENINIQVEKKEFFGLFGPNGAGKTTLLRIFTGQLNQTSGNASALGINTKNRMELKKKIGIVPEKEVLPSFLTAEEVLQFVCRIRNLDMKNVRYWLEFFDLTQRKDVMCKDLSKGMRQKLLLATAFIHAPEVLFLDEPFTSLDPIYQKKVKDYLTDYVKKGGTIFLCTHILEIAEKLCTRIGVINNGIIVGMGKLEEMKKKDEESLEDVFCRLVGKGYEIAYN